VTAIWRNDGIGWTLLTPAGFPDEAALHRLAEDAPHILPLADAPRLVMVGREVQLGSGYADLVAVEPSGRVVVIEVKLARNAEARRAVVAQVLAYAAPAVTGARAARHAGRPTDGADEFVASIDAAPADARDTLRRVAAWAQDLERAGLVRLESFRGKRGAVTLLPRLRPDDAGLVTFWNDNAAYVSI
jgi:hypothetical protein